MSRCITSTLIAAFCMLGFPHNSLAQESCIIVFSDVDEYSASDEIAVGALIQVPRGKTIKLLTTDTGRSIVIEGPYDGPLDLPPGAGLDKNIRERLIAAVSKLFTEDKNATMGAMRGFKRKIQNTPESRFLHATSASERFCYSKNSWPILLRSNSSTSTNIFIKNQKSQQRITKPWSAEEKEMSWPLEMPITNQDIFFIKVDDESDGLMVKMIHVDDQSLNDGQKIIALVNAGCDQQAHLLISGIQ